MDRSQRKSGIELLRLLCMFGIVAYHYSYHGGYRPLSEYAFSGAVLYLQMLRLFGRTACSVFALTTGYFLISAKGGFKEQFKRAVPLWFDMHFYYILALLVLYVCGASAISAKDILLSLLPGIFGTWYMRYYIILLLVVPILRPYITKLSKDDYKKLLLAIFLFWSVLTTVGRKDYWNYGDFDFFLVFFLFGGYIRLHMKRPEYYRKYSGPAMIIFFALSVLSVPMMDLAGSITGLRAFIDSAQYFGECHNILSVCMAISAFLWFSSLDFHRPAINEMASAVPGIYLLHNGFLMRRWLWQELYPNADYVSNPYLHSLIKITGCYFIFMLAAMICTRTEGKLFRKWWENHFDSVWNNVHRCFAKLLAKIP